MTKKNLNASNARHRFLQNRNINRMFKAHEKGNSNWKIYNEKVAYHRSVIDAQTRVNRVLTQEEKKQVFSAVKATNGRGVIYYPQNRG